MEPILKYSGVIVPTVTPLTDKIRLDSAAVARIIDRILAAGCYPFILGTTGEAALIPAEMKREMVGLVGRRYAGRGTLYAGIAATGLSETIENGKFCADQGIDVAVAAPPNGYPLGPEEQLRFFETLADRLPIPLFIYNIPQTTHISLDLETLDQLSTHPNIVGVKDSENNAARRE